MKKKFLFGKTWFFEDLISGGLASMTWGIIPEKEIFTGKSNFQRIEIFDTKEQGKILALDGRVQISTKYEFIYHEMLVHPAFFYHPKPEKVLIIGGGDGGVLKEVVKHPVKEIFLVEIDKKVIELSKKYLPSVSNGAFNDKRLKIFIKDGVKFIKKYNNYFDIVINDSTDPEASSKVLWKISFYKDILRALKESGIAAFQTAYFQERFAQKARKKIKRVFPFFKTHKAFVGSFPFDEHTFSFASKKINFDKVNPKKIKEKYTKLSLQTEYYSPEIHFISTILPKYLQKF